MKRVAYLVALASLLGVTPALAQKPAAPAPAAPKPAPAAAPAAVPKPAPAAAAPAAAAPAAAAPAAAAPAAAAPAAEPAAATPVAPAPVAPAAPAPVAPAVAPAPVAPTPAPAAPAPVAAEPSSLELFGALALSVVDGQPITPENTTSFRRVGVYGEGGVAFRSKYFLDPLISVGYGSLGSVDTALSDSDTIVNGQPVYTAGTLHQHIGEWVISPGVTTDLWRFRLRLGMGLGIVKESNRFHGEGNTATQLALSWQAGVGYNFYNVPHFRLDGEARFIQTKGADVTFWAFGITARGDAITF